jgi:hypothetical protein
MPRKSHDRLTYPSAPVRVISSSFHAKDAVAGLNTASTRSSNVLDLRSGSSY